MQRVLFVCVHNSGRSQMAEGLFNALAAERALDARAESAGTMPGDQVNPAAAEAMDEVGISLADHHPKVLTAAMVTDSERVITMGCGVDAAACPAGTHLSEDWGLDDPHGQGVEAVRVIRDQIRARVETLLDQLAR